MREFKTTVSTIDKPKIFKLVKKNHKPAIKGRFYPLQRVLPSEELIYDHDKKINRVIRYAPGELSIYKDEQPEKVVLGSIIFQNGTLKVPATNPSLLEFLEKSNLNASNPHRVKGSAQVFAYKDYEKEATKAMSDEMEEVRAINALMNMDFTELKGYARVLSVNIDNSADMIRHDMLRIAKADPKEFLSGMDDPSVKRQQVILEAISYKIIEVNSKGARWAIGNNGTLITPIPIGQSPISWFANWTMTEKEGEIVYGEIEKKLKKLSE